MMVSANNIFGNIVRKGENAGSRHVLVFPAMYNKSRIQVKKKQNSGLGSEGLAVKTNKRD